MPLTHSEYYGLTGTFLGVSLMLLQRWTGITTPTVEELLFPEFEVEDLPVTTEYLNQPMESVLASFAYFMSFWYHLVKFQGYGFSIKIFFCELGNFARSQILSVAQLFFQLVFVSLTIVISQYIGSLLKVCSEKVRYKHRRYKDAATQNDLLVCALPTQARPSDRYSEDVTGLGSVQIDTGNNTAGTSQKVLEDAATQTAPVVQKNMVNAATQTVSIDQIDMADVATQTVSITQIEMADAAIQTAPTDQTDQTVQIDQIDQIDQTVYKPESYVPRQFRDPYELLESTRSRNRNLTEELEQAQQSLKEKEKRIEELQKYIDDLPLDDLPLVSMEEMLGTSTRVTNKARASAARYAFNRKGKAAYRRQTAKSTEVVKPEEEEKEANKEAEEERKLLEAAKLQKQVEAEVEEAETRTAQCQSEHEDAPIVEEDGGSEGESEEKESDEGEEVETEHENVPEELDEADRIVAVEEEEEMSEPTYTSEEEQEVWPEQNEAAAGTVEEKTVDEVDQTADTAGGGEATEPTPELVETKAQEAEEEAPASFEPVQIQLDITEEKGESTHPGEIQPPENQMLYQDEPQEEITASPTTFAPEVQVASQPMATEIFSAPPQTFEAPSIGLIEPISEPAPEAMEVDQQPLQENAMQGIESTPAQLVEDHIRDPNRDSEMEDVEGAVGDDDEDDLVDLILGEAKGAIGDDYMEDDDDDEDMGDAPIEEPPVTSHEVAMGNIEEAEMIEQPPKVEERGEEESVPEVQAPSAASLFPPFQAEPSFNFGPVTTPATQFTEANFRRIVSGGGNLGQEVIKQLQQAVAKGAPIGVGSYNEPPQILVPQEEHEHATASTGQRKIATPKTRRRAGVDVPKLPLPSLLPSSSSAEPATSQPQRLETLQEEAPEASYSSEQKGKAVDRPAPPVLGPGSYAINSGLLDQTFSPFSATPEPPSPSPNVPRSRPSLFASLQPKTTTSSPGPSTVARTPQARTPKSVPQQGLVSSLLDKFNYQSPPQSRLERNVAQLRPKVSQLRPKVSQPARRSTPSENASISSKNFRGAKMLGSDHESVGPILAEITSREQVEEDLESFFEQTSSNNIELWSDGTLDVEEIDVWYTQWMLLNQRMRDEWLPELKKYSRAACKRLLLFLAENSMETGLIMPGQEKASRQFAQLASDTLTRTSDGSPVQMPTVENRDMFNMVHAAKTARIEDMRAQLGYGNPDSDVVKGPIDAFVTDWQDNSREFRARDPNSLKPISLYLLRRAITLRYLLSRVDEWFDDGKSGSGLGEWLQTKRESSTGDGKSEMDTMREICAKLREFPELLWGEGGYLTYWLLVYQYARIVERSFKVPGAE